MFRKLVVVLFFFKMVRYLILVVYGFFGFCFCNKGYYFRIGLGYLEMVEGYIFGGV